VVIPLNTKIRMASNLVRYYSEMFPGLRTISVQFFFNVGLRRDGRVEYLNICPLYTRIGFVIPFFELMVTNVFLSRQEVGHYVERIRHFPARQVIFHNARRLYLASSYEHRVGRYLKQLKRMHQCYNCLRWAFEPKEQEAIEKDIRRWLHSDWAVLVADLVEQGEMWQEDGLQMRGVFARAGELTRLAAFLRGVRDRLAGDPRVRGELGVLKGLAAQFAQGRAEMEDFVTLAETGRRLSKTIGPSREEMKRLLTLFSKKFGEMGFKKVTIYGHRRGRLLLWREELLAAGLDPAKVNLEPRLGGVRKLGAFTYEVIDRLEPEQRPLRALLFRSVFNGEPQRRFEQYYTAISWP
jgi:hypothetical protein